MEQLRAASYLIAHHAEISKRRLDQLDTEEKIERNLYNCKEYQIREYYNSLLTFNRTASRLVYNSSFINSPTLVLKNLDSIDLINRNLNTNDNFCFKLRIISLGLYHAAKNLSKFK